MSKNIQPLMLLFLFASIFGQTFSSEIDSCLQYLQYKPDPKDCSGYISLPKTYQCFPGDLWNTKIGACDLKSNVDCSLNYASDSTDDDYNDGCEKNQKSCPVCPVIESKTVQKFPGQFCNKINVKKTRFGRRYPDPNSHQGYFVCYTTKGQSYYGICSKGSCYSKTMKRCVEGSTDVCGNTLAVPKTRKQNRSRMTYLRNVFKNPDIQPPVVKKTVQHTVDINRINNLSQASVYTEVGPDKNTHIYNTCDLARDLIYVHGFHRNLIERWVCIIKQLSNSDYTAVSGGHANYGLFQISSRDWCGIGSSSKGCKINCNNLINTDFTDDMQCVRTIFNRHSWDAWSWRSCSNSAHLIANCKNLPDAVNDSGNPLGPLTASKSTRNQNFKRNVAISGNPTIFKSGNPVSNHKFQRDTEIGDSDFAETYVEVGPNTANHIYNKCDLARDLIYIYGFHKNLIDRWLCVIGKISSYDYTSVAPANANYGLFQISSAYWCEIGSAGKVCNIDCNNFIDSNIADDIACVRKIYDENDWNAWNWQSECSSTASEIANCENLPDAANDSGNPVGPIGSPELPARKTYTNCELATELVTTHSFPVDTIADVICLVKHQSAFKTWVVSDDLNNYGIFQFSKKYFCKLNGVMDESNECGTTCDKFVDTDISDDVACFNTILENYPEVGFDKWSMYTQNCDGDLSGYIAGCDQSAWPST